MTTPVVDSQAHAWQDPRQSATLETGHGISLGDCGARRRSRRAVAASVMPATPPDPQYTVGLLGGFEFRDRGEHVSLPLSVQRLVAFLALHDRALQRVHVAGTLWIDSTEEQANASLRTALWRVRQVMPPLISGTSTHLGLAAGVPVDAIESASRAQRVLGGGPVLADDGAELARSRELLPDWYDDWVVIERERLRQLALRALERISVDATAEGRYAQATEAGLGAVALEPLRESAHRVVIEAYLAEGNASEAIRQYRLFEGILESKLGLRPSPRMQELMRALTVR